MTLDLYRTKFRVQDLGHLIFSLTYFDDAEREEMPEMLSATTWKEIRATIEAWTRAFAASG